MKYGSQGSANMIESRFTLLHFQYSIFIPAFMAENKAVGVIAHAHLPEAHIIDISFIPIPYYQVPALR